MDNASVGHVEERDKGEGEKSYFFGGKEYASRAAANQARRQAAAQQMRAVGDLASAGTQMATAGMKMGAPGGQTGGMSANPDYDPNIPTSNTWDYNPPNPLDDGQDVWAG